MPVTLSIAIQTRNGFASESEFRYIENALDRIRRRAYERAAASGFPGRELDDWLAAERELFHVPPSDLSEEPGEYVARIAAPGFSPDRLSVAVDPRTAVVRGLTEAGGEPELFRRFDFDREINLAAVQASFENGTLVVHLPKAPAALLPAVA